jgi:alanyl-tRNA synthetase
MEEPFIYRLIPLLAETMGRQYPELESGKEQIAKIIFEEETAFLKTLGKGLKMIDKMVNDLRKDKKNTLPGKAAFELYDTFGFPVDLTQLILRENDMGLDSQGFEEQMRIQKERSREDAVVETADWKVVNDIEGTIFTGYEKTEDEVLITKYRKVKIKGKETIQLVLDRTPFYGESGGQAGDTGVLVSSKEKIVISDTVKENNLIIHIATSLPTEPEVKFAAKVDLQKRLMTANNHTATHLLHQALRAVLGNHVEQKGSLVTADRLRFDFSHFSKPGKEELASVENFVNRLIRENHSGIVTDNIPMEKARSMGAIALFGEKYGDKVRVIEFGSSVELCGGTHVKSTGSIGLLKIISEGAIASGIRRIEAVTAEKAIEYINEKINNLDDISVLLKSTGNVKESVEKLIAENLSLKKTIEKFEDQSAEMIIKELLNKAVFVNNLKFISDQRDKESPEMLRNIAFRLRKSSDDTVLVLGSASGGKANIIIMVSDNLVKTRNISATTLIREISGEINGSGGGQPFLATAGGKNPSGIASALEKVFLLVQNA